MINFPVNPMSPPVTTVSTTTNTKKASRETTATDTNIYIIIAGGVIGFALVITGLILLFVCRKWQRKKLSGMKSYYTFIHKQLKCFPTIRH